MSRSTTKQFRAPFASAGGTADGRDEALLFISSTPSDILIWIRDSWATVEGALGGQTWRILKTLSERFRRRNYTHARENRDNRAEPNGRGLGRLAPRPRRARRAWRPVAARPRPPIAPL